MKAVEKSRPDTPRRSACHHWRESARWCGPFFRRSWEGPCFFAL